MQATYLCTRMSGDNGRARRVSFSSLFHGDLVHGPLALIGATKSVHPLASIGFLILIDRASRRPVVKHSRQSSRSPLMIPVYVKSGVRESITHTTHNGVDALLSLSRLLRALVLRYMYRMTPRRTQVHFSLCPGKSITRTPSGCRRNSFRRWL